MRLDKFLKVSRIIKRRAVANSACDLNRVLLNGKEAKPSKEVKVGDIITINFGDKPFSFRVLVIPDGNVKKEETKKLFEPIV